MKKDDVEKIIKSYGKRINPSPEMMAKAKANVQQHWQKKVRAKKTQRQSLIFKVAASMLVIFTAGYFINENLQNRTDQPFIQVAHIIYHNGPVESSKDEVNWNSVITSDPIHIGDWVKTFDYAQLALILNDNSQIRINSNTQLKWSSNNNIELVKGEIYHDTDLASQSNPLVIVTEKGNIEHIGTRYAVKYTEDELEVSVRNGTVQLENDTLKKDVERGTKVAILPDGQIVETSIESYSDQWSWTQTIQPEFLIENKSLGDFVKWVAHEKGYEIDWGQNSYQANQVKLSGNLNNLDLNQALEMVFLSTKFDYSIDQGIFHILKKND